MPNCTSSRVKRAFISTHRMSWLSGWPRGLSLVRERCVYFCVRRGRRAYKYTVSTVYICVCVCVRRGRRACIHTISALHICVCVGIGARAKTPCLLVHTYVWACARLRVQLSTCACHYSGSMLCTLQALFKWPRACAMHTYLTLN